MIQLPHTQPVLISTERSFVLLLPFYFVFLLIEMYTGLESAFERHPTSHYIVSI